MRDPALKHASADRVVPTTTGSASQLRADAPIDLPEAVPDLPEATRKPSATRAVAGIEGTAAPGLRLWLEGGRSEGEDLKYLWVQTHGPTVDLGRADQSRIAVAVPAGATELGFRLVVSGRTGIDSQAVRIPIEHFRSPGAALVADAGDDQVACVGSQVTLNGIRSIPKQGLAYRWIQVEGPTVRSKIEEGWTCVFTPEAPGLYRFLLVVGGAGAISKPDEVRLVVSNAGPERFLSASERSEPIERLVASRAAAIGGSPGRKAALASAFEEVAHRVDLYTAYEDVLVETSRRIDAAIPPQSAERDDWEQLLFEPISGEIIRVLRAANLDLALEGAESEPLTDIQKAHLAAVFRAIARGFQESGRR